jgi:hypothetical protein
MKILWTVCLAMLLGTAGLGAQASQSASDGLNKSREELKELLTKYTDLHPLVMMKREQIGNLEKVVALRELLKAREELGELLTKYTNLHPLLVAKREQIAGLEKAAARQRGSEASLAGARDLQKALEELNDLSIKYTDQNPVVVAKCQQVVALEKSWDSIERLTRQ